MIRKILKKRPSKRLDALPAKYRIPSGHLATNRRTVSRGLGVGLFFAFLPIPLQMAAVLLPIPLFRYNVVIALTMVWLTNPLTMPFIYYAEYRTGTLLLLEESRPDIILTLAWFAAHFDAIVIPLFAGALFWSLLLGTGSYLAVNLLWIRSVQRQKHAKRELVVQRIEQG